MGRPRDAHLGSAIAEYERRAARYWPLETREVRSESARDSEATQARVREGERLLTFLPAGAQLIACDVAGRGMASEIFATWMRDARERAAEDVAFAIGGAFGLSEALLGQAAMRLSLAPWTLSHELARLVLAEQLYRAGTIVRGEPYHK